jgi:hypothetical protein
MATGRLVRSLALLAAGGLSGACATTRYTQSQVDALPPGVEGKAGSRAAVEIEGLKLDLQPLDRVPEEAALRHLTVRIAFAPRELGYSFDPGEVVLRTADGREWRARGGEYLPLFPESSFDLAFGATVEPGATVELILGGLARGTKRLEPVSFRLSRRRGRSIDRMYWLEAVGYAMAVLTYPYGGM